MYGIADELINKLKDIKEKYKIKILLFGSRARGDYKHNSDIDIAVVDTVSKEIKYQIMDELDKIDTPYKFDLVFVQNVENKEFLKSIYSEGVKIWKD